MPIRFGLCCIFLEQPINFRTTTVTHISKLDRKDALNKLSGLCLENAKSLLASLEYCKDKSIGSFRINSRMFPCKTHDVVGYELADLPDSKEIISLFESAKQFAKVNNIRTAFHPDQFVVLNSAKDEVVRQSIKEIEYHADLAEMIGSDVINIHAGYSKPNKDEALGVFEKNFYKLSERTRKLLTVENDDVTYTPSDLLPLCEKINIPLVYDVHHHKCNPDNLSVESATELAIKTWNREPMFHISSPIDGYGNSKQRMHHDYINLDDFPLFWLDHQITVEIEAKAKELAVEKLILELSSSGISP